MSFQEFHNEDCFVNMKVFKDKSINLILTSPFYNTNKKAGRKIRSKTQKSKREHILILDMTNTSII